MFSNGIKFLTGMLVTLSCFAITPQKYCENLAATSCEVLNITADNSLLLIKYCRNRQFKASGFHAPSGGPTLNPTIITVYSAGTPHQLTLGPTLCTQAFGSGDLYLP